MKNLIGFGPSLEFLLPSWELNRDRERGLQVCFWVKTSNIYFFYGLCISLSFPLHQSVYTDIDIYIYTHTYMGTYHISLWAWGSVGPCITLSNLMPKLFCFTTLLLMFPVMKRFLSAWLNPATQLVFHWKYLCHIIFSPDVLEISFIYLGESHFVIWPAFSSPHVSCNINSLWGLQSLQINMACI